MKNLCLVVFVFLLISFNLFSSEVDQVFLKNGQVVEGIVQNYEIGKYVEIVTLENRRQIINWDQIESLSLASEDELKTDQVEHNNKPDIKLNIDAKKGFEFDQTLDSDQLRLNWESQGGFIKSYDFAVNYILTKMDFSDSLSGDMKLDGFGFGYNANLNLLKFSPPNYAENKYYSYAAKLGFSVGINANMFETKFEDVIMDSVPGVYSSHTNIEVNNDIRVGTMEFGLNLGVNFGLGKFFNPEKWGGVILGVAWRPTWQWTETNTTTITDIWYASEIYVPYYQYIWDWDYSEDITTESNTQFSWSAVEFTLDVGGVKAMTAKMAKRAHIRLNLMIVPPIGEYNISMLYLGMGVVWYR